MKDLIMAFLKVKSIAESQGFNILTLSRKAEIAYGTTLGLWHDKAHQFNRRTLIRVARALGVKVSDLFDENADQEPIDKHTV
jgi:DNA-binding Xre family transcriptional regulator